jgi:flagellar biosynthetic protein FliP
MTTELTSTRWDARIFSRANLRFGGHLLEMVVAMFVGMFALAPVWSLAAPGLTDRPAAHAMVMATDMTAGMVLWMWIRRHSWPRIAEMSAAMYLPFVALLVPYWLGGISGETLMMGGHVLMPPLMLAAMLWRRDDYRHSHRTSHRR